MWRALWCACVLLSFVYPSCRIQQHDITVEFHVAEGHNFSRAERRAIQTVADSTTIEVRRFLPALPPDLVLKVQAGKQGTPETGETPSTLQPNIVLWTVDPNRAGGVVATVRSELRPTLFHEFHHLVRGATAQPRSLMDWVIAEGMATAFERDFAGARPPWGAYPDNVMDWVNELRALPPTTGWDNRLMILHPDGRRWIGYKSGTYLVDRAARSSGRSSASLVSTPTDSVIRMALRR
jgi:Predicted Zn-dependent protease (DUF2268)